MGVIRITKDFRFETGHALYGYDENVKIFMDIILNYLLQ